MTKTAAEYVRKYLGTFLANMSRAAPNSATSDNCRRVAESMIEAAVAEVRAEEEEKRQRWRKNVALAISAQIDKSWSERDEETK